MKVSFIICYSSSKPMTIFDPDIWKKVDKKLDEQILFSTNKLIKQILSIPVEKEILLMDNSGDFKTDIIHKDLIITKSHGSWSDEEFDKNKSIFSNIRDKIHYEFIKSNQAETTALAYNHGLAIATGDYTIISHNDIAYLFDYYSKDSIIKDLINHLEDNNLEYITIDKKPRKASSPEGYEYFADCYWFLCRGDFYKKHNIWVDWCRGDNNHLATIICIEKKLPFQHIPGYYETGGIERENQNHFIKTNYPLLFEKSINFHIFNNKLFLAHTKGGTGLKRLNSKRYNASTIN